MGTTLLHDFLGSFTINLDDSFPIDRFIKETGAWELHVTQLINRFTVQGHTCIDVGANAGYHTLAMAGAVGASGHVFAFEPNYVTYPKLLENLSLNPQIASRVTCIQAGLSDKVGELRVYQSGEEPGNAYVSDKYDESLWNMGTPDDYTVCKVHRLDSYIQPLLPPGALVGVIKIDVEGMELEVLRGAHGILTTHLPTVLFETSLVHFSHDKIKESEVYLRSLGYELLGIHPETSKLTPVTYPDFGIDTVAVHRSKIGTAQI